MTQDSIAGYLRLVRMTPGTRQGMVVKELRRDFAAQLMMAWTTYVGRSSVLTTSACGPADRDARAQLVLLYTFVDENTSHGSETLFDWESISAATADEFCREYFRQTLGEAEREAFESPVHVQLPEKANPR